MEIDNFLSYLILRKNYSGLTVSSYKSDLLQFEEFLSKNNKNFSKLGNDYTISANDIRAWVINLSNNHIGTRSINRKLSTLKSYFKWVEKNNPDFVNPMIKIISPKTAKRKIGFISQEDMADLISVKVNDGDFKSFRDFLIIELLYSTGIRQGELLNIKESDIDIENKQLRVVGKGNKARIIPLGNKIIDGLIKYIDLKRRLDIKEQNLMVNQDGSLLTKNQLYYMIHKRLQNYNLQERSAHVFRHTCATHLIENGADIINVKNLLGHANLSATEVYTHATVEQLKQEYKRSFEQNF